MIDYRMLRDIQKKERKQELSKIPSNFYEECRKFIEEKTKEYTKTLNPEKRLLVGNSIEIISEIRELRYEKIVHMAAIGNPSPNMVGSEKNLYADLRKTCKNYKENNKRRG
ncbi:MAG: hypothetical protein BZ134_00165 [Methanosphaera sp. SHI1033]|nr:MAG: hypothetical protein BZ134_00165 [Methanosphaera sp. SHI1033]